MDENWLYAEAKQQSMDWRHSGSPRPKKFRVQKSASFFCDEDVILLINYLPKGQTIHAECYSSLLVQLKDILKEKRRGKFTKRVLFLHDNAPSHRALVTQRTGLSGLLMPWAATLLSGSGPTCSLDWKTQLKVLQFSSDAKVITAAETWLDGQLLIFWVVLKS
jgi:hypothetical protein